MRMILDLLLGGVGAIVLAFIVSGVVLLSLHDPAIITYAIALVIIWIFGFILRKMLTRQANLINYRSHAN